MAKRVLVVAGEASGDLRGAELVAALRTLVPDVEVFGVGGEHLRSAGVEILVDAAELSTMGFTELFSRAGAILTSFRTVRDAIDGRAGRPRPDLVILIDFPDFNLRLAKVAKQAGVPVLYYVAPQVWAWRRYRVKQLARRVDRLAVVFPFEEEIYRGLTRVDFVGHPALETVRATRSAEETRAKYGLPPGYPLVTLLPGSRAAEVESLLPTMFRAIDVLRGTVEVDVAVALAHERLRRLVEPISGRTPVVSGDTYNLIAAADLVLCASGSATLETALLERPMVLMYRLSPLTYALARLLVRVPFIGMPNLILGKRAVPELVQGEVRPSRIAAEARAILCDPARAAAMRADLATVRARLGEPGAARRAAEIAAEMLDATAA
ncbi:MAG TPA: lipid-A-disaccharide synthase [Candidatus Binatia bacterium]|nr:lipid-A-disaccharide synthase [Candidatus Binatia bacterium]